MKNPSSREQRERAPQTDEPQPEKQFRGWRLLGVIGLVVLLLAIVSFVVDWLVIGPLEGRVF